MSDQFIQTSNANQTNNMNKTFEYIEINTNIENQKSYIQSQHS